ncbi:unnamed protein product [Colias eurytheme]|nr:unnamed protein product [Colias eurytheme]
MAIISYVNLLHMIFRMNDIFQGTVRTDPMDYIILSLSFGVMAIQLLFTVILITALHKNSTELLEAYYECNICMFATQTTVALFYIPLQVYRWRPREDLMFKLTVGMIIVAAVIITMQFYLISLIRSQLKIMKRGDVEDVIVQADTAVAGPSDDRGDNK